MEAKYINPFLDAFKKTMEQLGIKVINTDNHRKKDKLYVDLGVSSSVYLKGGIQGNIALSMNRDTAKKVTTTMMMDMNIPANDSIVRSAIGELSSMITGTASTMLSALGLSLQISPPIVIFESSDVNLLETLAIDFETQLGKIELNIGFVMN